MSKFSGKCDVYDCLVEMKKYTLDELKNNVTIRVGSEKEPLIFNSMADLIPYYPYMISLEFSDNKSRKSNIIISSKSWVDKEEEDILIFYKEQLLKFYNRNKRKGMNLREEDIMRKLSLCIDKDAPLEMCKRMIREDGDFDIDGIHLKSHEYYRELLVEEMVKNGIDPRIYGYDRFVK